MLKPKVMNKKECLSMFLKHYFNYLSFLNKYIKNPKHSKKFKIFIEKNYLVKKTNPSYLIKTWYTKISDPYLVYIKNKNKEFFMNKDYSTELQDEVKKEVNINSITEQCKIIFNTINDEEKDIIWKYLKILSELSSLYITNIST